MTSNPPPPKAGQAQTHTPTPEESKKRLRRFAAYPRPMKIYEQENCFQVTDGSQLWYAYTQKKEHADEIVAALASHSSLLASHERLKQAAIEAEELLVATAGINGAAQTIAKLRTALSTAHSVNNG